MVAGALIVVVVAAAAIAIPRLTDVNRYRSTIEARVAERLGRRVTLGQIELRVFPQLSAVIHDVQVEGQGLEGPRVLSASTVRARAELWPFLFSRRLQLTALTLDEPQIAVVRSTTGEWNWAAILQRRATTLDTLPSVPPPSPAPSGERPSLILEDLVIHGGSVRIVDQAADPGRSVALNIAALDLELHGYRAGRPFNCQVSGEVSGQEGRGNLAFKGRAGPLPTPFAITALPIQGTFKTNTFPLRAIFPYVRTDRGIRSLSGALTSDLDLENRPGSQIEMKGELNLDKVLLALGGDVPRSATLDFDASLDVASSRGGKELTIRKLEITSSGGQLSLQGQKQSRDTGDEIALKMRGSDVRIHELAPLAKLAGVDLPLDAVGSEPFDIEGAVETETSPSGRRLVLRDVQVRGIEASIRRGAGGSVSLAGSPSPPPTGASNATRTEIHNLQVEDANITIHDAATGGGQSVPLRLTGLQLKVDRLGTGSAGRGSLTATIDGAGRVEGSGTLGPEANGQLPVDAKLRLEQAKMSTLRRYLAGVPGVESGAGTVDLDVAIRGRSPERLALNGKLELREGEIALPKPGGGSTRESLQCEATFDAVSERGGERITFNSCRVSLPSGTFNLTGSLDRAGGRKVADLTLAPTRLKIEDLQAFAGLVGFTFPGVMESPEPVAVAARIRGDLADRSRLAVDGSLKTSRLTWQTPYFSRPLENVNATFAFAGDVVEAKPFSATLGKTTLRGDLAVRNFASPDLTFAITTDRADVSELLSNLSGKAGPVTGSAVNTSSGNTPGSMSKLRGRGTIAIGSGTFQTLSFSALRGNVTMDGGVLHFAPLEFGLYGGKYEGDSEIDLRSGVPVFKHRSSLAAIDANAFLSANTNFKDGLHGSLSGRVNVNGRGTTMDDVLRSLDGTGDLQVTGGRFMKVSMLKGLSDVTDLFGERTLNQIAQKAATNDTPFTLLASAFRVSGGWVTIDDLTMKSPDYSFIAKGGFGFDRRLQLQGKVAFSEAISQSLRQERSRAIYLGEEEGRVAIPVSVAGTLDRPAFNVDFGAAAGYAVGKSIADRIADALSREKAPEEQPPTGEPPTPETSPEVPSPTAPIQSPAPTPSQPKSPAPTPSQPKSPAPTPPAKSPAPSPTASPSPTTPAAPSAPVDLRVRVDEHGFRGSMLAPDIASKGVVSGRRLAGLLVVVLDDGGREVHRATLLRQEIIAAYGKRLRDERISVPFNITIPGAKLPHLSKWFKVQLAAVSDDKKTSAPVSFVERKAVASDPTPGN